MNIISQSGIETNGFEYNCIQAKAENKKLAKRMMQVIKMMSCTTYKIAIPSIFKYPFEVIRKTQTK